METDLAALLINAGEILNKNYDDVYDVDDDADKVDDDRRRS